MILSLFMAFALAQQEPTEPPPPELAPDDGDVLAPYRLSFDVLTERTIGLASKPVLFNWREKKLQLAVNGSFPFELNNFNSLRAGGMVRVPASGTLVEFGLSYVDVWDSYSSEQLALTPYRQPGRPDRLELEVTLAYPLGEGVITTAPRWFPAVQMVFNAYGGVRYNIYPEAFPHMKVREVFTAIMSPSLSELEVENLDDSRLDAMQTDLGRYGLMIGLGNDVYFEQGLFVSPRMMLGIPLLAPASQTELLFWADFSMAVGVAF